MGGGSGAASQSRSILLIGDDALSAAGFKGPISCKRLTLLVASMAEPKIIFIVVQNEA